MGVHKVTLGAVDASALAVPRPRKIRRLGFLGAAALVATSASSPAVLAQGGESTGTSSRATFVGSIGSVRRSDVAVDRPAGALGGGEGEYDKDVIGPIPEDPGAISGTSGAGPVKIGSSGAQGGGGSITFRAAPVTVVDLPTTKWWRADSVAEPQVAIDGDRMFVTWNWGARQSLDGGATFSYVDPNDGVPGGFCCDQLAAHIPGAGRWVWLRQGRVGDSGLNVDRLSIADDAGFDSATFQHYDFSAQDLGFGDREWLDQPRLGWNDRFLYLTSNVYFREPEQELNTATGEMEWVDDNDGAVVWRVPLDELGSGHVVVDYFTTHDLLEASGYPLFSLAPIQRGGDPMYLGAIHSQSTLDVVSWPDDSSSYRVDPVAIVDATGARMKFQWSDPTCKITGVNEPGQDWCANISPRLSPGWPDGRLVGWAWPVAQDPSNGRPYPYIWVVEVDPTELTACGAGSCVKTWMELWSSEAAFSYPAFTANASGDIGGVVLYGGGSYLPGCAAAIALAGSDPESPWLAEGIAASEVGTPDARWGDYLGVALEADGSTFAGSCMSIHPQGADQVHVARFGGTQVVVAAPVARSLPSISPPQGEPPTPRAEPTSDLMNYVGEPDDPSGFLAAYRIAFPEAGAGYGDGDLLANGLELCTYLVRHAADGSHVAMEDAITEADQRMPGFPRSAWAPALQLANQYLCPEFLIEGASTDGDELT